MIKTYDDPLKQIAREKLRNFIERTLFKYKKPEDVRVVCFPGAEVRGEEGLEVKEVYDALGIPRENIVGLEYDTKKAHRLERAKVGIDVVCQDALDYFRTTEKIFDVISLDYTGQRTWREADISRYIAGRQLLQRRGVFCTNHLAKREGEKIKQTLRNISFSAQIGNFLLEGSCRDLRSFANMKLEEVIANIPQQAPERDSDMDYLRSWITGANLAVFSHGRMEINPSGHLFANNAIYKRALDKLVASPRAADKGLAGKIPHYFDYFELFRGMFVSAVGILANDSLLTSEQAKKLLQIIAISHDGGYIPETLERYTYTSNKNANMLMDVFFFKQLNHSLVQKANEIISFNPLNGTIKLNPFHWPRDKLVKRVQRFEECAREENLVVEISEPVNLGSSWRAPRKEDRINKQQAIELLQTGFSTVEIANCYRGFTVMQLAALKAHYITMGKKLEA